MIIVTLNVIGRENELYCPLKSLANVLKQFLQKFPTVEMACLLQKRLVLVVNFMLTFG